METKYGKIISVVPTEGANDRGPWKRWVFVMEEGTRYSTFNADIGENYKAGDSVEMSGVQNGKFWNMKSMKKTNAETTTTEKPKIVQTGASEDLLRQILAHIKEMNNILNDIWKVNCVNGNIKNSHQ
jgi:hypothetical protein